MSRRAVLIKVIVLAAFLIVQIRLVDLMVLKHDLYTSIARLQRTIGRQVLIRRGAIYDRNGTELAINLERPSIYCDPKVIKRPEKVALTLKDLINRKPAELMEAMAQNRRFVWLARKVSPRVARKVEMFGFEGLGVLQDTSRFYPLHSMAAHVLGFVDIDNNGQEGIEKVYNKELIGELQKSINRRVYLRRDARGNLLYSGVEFESQGYSVVLTIDQGLQAIVESALNRVVDKHKPRAVSAILMDPYTGEILALANRPSFDPNEPGRYRASYRRNRAVTDLYEPGSTFKIVMATAALEEGIATLNTRVDCSGGVVEVAGKRIRDTHKHGRLTLKEIIQKSSNVGAVKIALKLGPELFFKYVKKYGFGQKTGIDLTGESPGIVKSPSEWSGTTLAAMAIGYEVMVTPLQVLNAYAVVANGGYRVRPHLLKAVMGRDGELLRVVNSSRAERVISARTTELLKEAFKAVVSEGGTAVKAAIPGNTVAGKTGTTKLIDPKTGRYTNKHFVSSFVGMVPVKRPVFVGIVVVWDPKHAYYGGEVAAPAFREIAEKALSYLSVPREDNLKDHILVYNNREEPSIIR
ncbi:MAG: penicillin-binding protein 2 [Nitrospirae bacterium]|nr:MAG: penicillin-binding protein 2 [Nitrospirota bacterium]